MSDSVFYTDGELSCALAVIREQAAEIERLRAALREIVRHWDEFEHGHEFERVIETARKALGET